MKNYLKFLVFLLVVNVLSSCKDEFTEKDAMDALQVISMQIGVHDASQADAALAGVQVKAIIDTSVVTVTTNSNGIAVFNNIKIGGSVNILASKEGYTTMFTTVYTVPDDYRQTVVSGNVYMYATSGSNVATMKGQLTIETDLTNRVRESVANVHVLAYNSSLYGTDNFFVDTTDSNGNYTILVPIDSDGGNDIYVYFPTVELDRTVGVEMDDVYSIETKPAMYSASNYGETAVDKVPSALIEIDAPPASGTGFKLGLLAVRNSLSTAVNNETYSEAIVSGGTGYTGAENFVFAADPSGNQAELNISVNGEGIITSMSIVNNGATYSSMPAIVTNPTTGSGAVFDFRFRSMYRVFIENSGSGYLSFPTVGVDYTSSVDNTSKLKKEFYPDMDASNPLGGGDLFNNAFIAGGAIIQQDQTEGDTLFTTGYVYSMPTFTYSGEDRRQATYYATLSAVNVSDSTLTDNFSYNNQGNGYDFSNPPTVTVTALAGYGSGAIVRAEVNNDGEVSDLVVMAKGAGYTQDINDYDGDGVYNEEEDADLIGFSTWSTGYGRHDNVKPGLSYIGNVFYGTGMKVNP